ncbi:DUF4410 domain-containing protein [Paraburkholderia sp. J67]|uniref:DUF4410 domain-containing protein n=1 Tax=Paraburkholderia sp. J67 TaxID=2805435 RepID=UPI002ABE88FF|nr:DUF4410 domain-containing protein [Paraburkholderia sp. J67]
MIDRRRLCIRMLLTVVLGAVASTAFAQTGGTAPIVYVSDFELDDASVTADQNPVDNTRRFAGGLLPRPLLRRDDPHKRASDIVEQMAQKLVADLQHAGLDARRLPVGATPPAQGWLVRGVFLDVDEGNRLRRAIVGFGSGATEVDLAVAIDDLSKQAPAPLYQVIESHSSTSKPGAGAAIALNPYVAAAKFVLARGDQRKTVERAAGEVSDAVVARVKSAQ